MASVKVKFRPSATDLSLIHIYGKTEDEMSIDRINKLIKSIKDETYSLSLIHIFKERHPGDTKREDLGDKGCL